MTRINVIAVELLTDQHLIAEYRELPRILNGVFSGKQCSLVGMPAHYVLGKGHVIFFRNKLLYLNRRHQQLVAEGRKRQFDLKFSGELLQQYSATEQAHYQDLLQDWQPNSAAQALNIERLLIRIAQAKITYHFYKQPIDYAAYLELLRSNDVL